MSTITALRFADKGEAEQTLNYRDPIKFVSEGEVVSMEEDSHGYLGKEIQRLTGSRVFQALEAWVPTGADKGFSVSIYMDDEGKITGRPIDMTATHATAALMEWGSILDAICGPIIVTLFDPETGAEKSMEDFHIKAVRNVLRGYAE